MRGTLFVVATPIGNLEDVTLRALRVLKEVKLIAAEDTRVTAKLLSRYEISTPRWSFREQNAASAVPRLLERLSAGDDIALVCDAGTPGISDPGVALVEAAAEAGHTVTPIPGASALAAAMSVAALGGEGVRFAGFLPRGGKERRARLSEIGADLSCTVLYESPNRLAETLRDLAAACGETRRAVVLRELTKLHEEIARGTLGSLAEKFEGGARGEIAIAVEGAKRVAVEVDDEALRAAIADLLAHGASARDAASETARAFDVPRKRCYALALDEANRR